MMSAMKPAPVEQGNHSQTLLAVLWTRVSWRKSYTLLTARDKHPIIFGSQTDILWFGNTMLHGHELEVGARCHFVDDTLDDGR